MAHVGDEDEGGVVSPVAGPPARTTPETLPETTDSSVRGATSSNGETDPAEARRGTGFLAVAQSVGAAMIGVQSSKNRQRDFTEGKAIHFIVGGLIGTLLFLFAVWLLVQYVLATS